ncbi:gluconate 2-dehydrogenase subunit 3 family protein [Seonamhaeicola sp. MEBiC1930]|uniref:gluconate 2-dehydrogenase subunit 3 family protein n=1 Tax=Seonamhaeicola sp. MEBiC01930 TaxID=2976768 RepID=UPI0032537BC6
MKRRTAIKGLLGITGVGVTSFAGYKYFLGATKHSRGQLKDYYQLISELVDVIIPPTDTPGAKEALVQDYVIDFMEDCASNKEYNNFLNGLIDLQEDSNLKFGNSFEECSNENKIEILKSFESGVSDGIISKINNKIKGRSFFNIIRTLTVEGYCTSTIGATQHLVYEPVPGRYNAITTLSPNQKAWATR